MDGHSYMFNLTFISRHYRPFISILTFLSAKQECLGLYLYITDKTNFKKEACPVRYGTGKP